MPANIFSQYLSTARAVVLCSLWALALVGCGGGSGGGGGVGVGTASVAAPTVSSLPVTATSPGTPTTQPTVDTSEITPTPSTPSLPIERASISLLAGRVSGGPGNIDGVGTGARFALYVGGMASDAAGNLYVADTQNLTLRKVSPTGVVTTLAGRADTPYAFDASGRRIGVTPDLVDGQGSEARFYEPTGVAVDSTGMIYVMDSAATTTASRLPVIRKVSSTGVVTTLKLDPESTAWRVGLDAIAVDMANNLYVTASKSQPNQATAVLKISPSGSVSVLASFQSSVNSNSAASPSNLTRPSGIAVDSGGNVYVGDDYHFVSRKITPAGVVSYFPPVTSPPIFNIFNGDRVVGVDAADNVLIEYSLKTVKRVSPSGQEISSFSSSKGYGAVIVGLGQSFYYVDGTEIKKVDANGSESSLAGLNRDSACWGAQAVAGVAVCSPGAVATDASGTVYFIDGFTRLRKVTNDGVVSGPLLDKSGLGGLAVDAAGNIFVGERSVKTIPALGYSGYDGGTVLKVSPTGAVSSVWTSALITPDRIAIDGSGNLYVGITYQTGVSFTAANETIVKLSPDGRELGQLLDKRSGFGARDFLVDAQGNLVIASNNRIRKISPAGVSTGFGLAGSPGAVDGPGDTARFSEISGLTFDFAGNTYVADKDNHAIRKISPTGVVSTVVGKLGLSGLTLGDLPGSLFQPRGLAFDSAGTLYVSSGDAILKVKLP